MVTQIGPIIIEDELSEYVDYVEGDVCNIPPSFIGNIMNIATGLSLDDLGDLIELTFSVKVKATAGGESVYNQAVINALGLPADPKTNKTKVAIFSIPQKEISNMSAAGQGGSAVKVGDKITYSISYENDDVTDAAVTIIDKLADGVDYVLPSSSGSYDELTHTVTWTLVDVPSGAGGLVSMVVEVTESAIVRKNNQRLQNMGGQRQRA